MSQLLAHRDTLAAALANHRVWGFNGSQVACQCDHVWREAGEHVRHQSDALGARCRQASRGLPVSAELSAAEVEALHGAVRDALAWADAHEQDDEVQEHDPDVVRADDVTTRLAPTVAALVAQAASERDCDLTQSDYLRRGNTPLPSGR